MPLKKTKLPFHFKSLDLFQQEILNLVGKSFIYRNSRALSLNDLKLKY